MLVCHVRIEVIEQRINKGRGMSAEDLALFLRKKMGEQRSNNTEMVRRTGISRRTWYRLLNADIDEARLSTLVKLANALDVNVTQLMDVYFGYRHKATKNPKTNTPSTNLPSNSLITVGQTFVKVWELKNTSICQWQGLVLKCIDDHLDIQLVDRAGSEAPSVSMLKPENNQIEIPDTPIGGVIKVSVSFLAPDTPCTTVSHWRFYQDEEMLQGQSFPILDCLIKVVTPECNVR
jgi:DNA-binding Xre family transcriptional regulator